MLNGNDEQSTPSATELSQTIKKLLKPLKEERADAVRLDELRKVFSNLSASGELSRGRGKSGNPIVEKWTSFLLSCQKEFVSQLCRRVQFGKRTAIRCFFGLIAGVPNQTGEEDLVDTNLLKKWLRSISEIDGDLDKTVRHMIGDEFLKPFRDIQYYSLGAIGQLAEELYASRNDDGYAQSIVAKADKLVEILMMVPFPSDQAELASSQFLFPPQTKNMCSKNDVEFEEDDNRSVEIDDDHDSDGSSSVESEPLDKQESMEPKKRATKRRRIDSDIGSAASFQQMSCFKRDYEKAWLSVLKLSVSTSQLKRVLHFLPSKVLEKISHPLLFSDFFTKAFSDHESGLTGVLALEGIFLLITAHGLEYNDFYKQLYRLVTPRVFYVKYRSRFFELLTKCLLRNDMLPAHIVAAFCKRMCRCALSSPTPSILFCLALISNLLRKHPECGCLVNRKSSKEMEDPFDADENDPVKTKALQSSLWELVALERHYYPAVVTLAKAIGTKEENKMPLHPMEEFTHHSYNALFDQEKKKKAKTALTFQKPERLLSEKDLFHGILEI